MTQMLRFALGLTALLVWLTGAAVAQEPALPDFNEWETVASTAEEAIDATDTTETMLEVQRARLVEYRTEFDAARNLNAARISALREQLAALGTAPESEVAEPESPEVAANREELNRQLNTLLTPVQRAESAYLRADALIGQIDVALRERQTEQLMEVVSTPLNPVHWQTAINDLIVAAGEIASEAPDKAETARRSIRSSLPAVLALTVLGLVLILRGHHWSTAIVGRLQRFGARGFGIWRFVVSLLRIILPTVGMVLLVMGVLATGWLGPRGSALLQLLPAIGGAMLGVRWVAERVFSRDEDEALILLPRPERKAVRFYVSIITVTVLFGALIDAIFDGVQPAETTEAVLRLPVLLISAFALFRIGRILHGHSDPTPDETPASEEPRVSTLSRVVRGLGLGAMIVAIVSPLLLISGYYNAAVSLLPPYVTTLVLLGLVMTLQRFLADVYGAMTGQGVQARDALMPVFFGLILLLLSLPVMALAWGARVTDLTELWALFSRGFAFGETRVRPTDFLSFAVIFVIGYGATRLIQGALRSNVLPKTRMDIGGQNAIVSGIGYVGIFLAALLAITGAGIDLSALAYVAGALSVGIGFGLQNVVSNFVSGIILLIERPISEGDWIEVGGQMGYVRDISVRSTRIETFDRTDVIVPNADLISGTVTNYTRGNTVGRLIVPVGVAYGTDTKRIEGILEEIAKSQPIVLTNPPPAVLFLNFGADALEFEVRCYLRDVNWMMKVKNDINHAIAARFKEEGIEIPFAQRDLWLRNPEAFKPEVADNPQADESNDKPEPLT
ncbi:putative MscS family protein.1 [Sulfitobacter sp. DSM 110093]|nr:putative MscS family protein.1 [Sulfitobacter sp. DSM 110093]